MRHLQTLSDIRFLTRGDRTGWLGMCSGLRVRRIARYARGSDGTQHFWIGRLKESGKRTMLPGLRFDFIEER